MLILLSLSGASYCAVYLFIIIIIIIIIIYNIVKLNVL